MKELVSYVRVSTERQKIRGMGLEAQQSAVRAYALRCSGEIVAEFHEAESGARNDRPELARAVAAARARGATLVVAKLDRLARDVRKILELFDEGGISIHLCDLPDLNGDDPDVARLMLTMLAAVAEFERKRIGRRIRAAIAERKKAGIFKRRKVYFSKEAREAAVRASAVKRGKSAAAFRATIMPVVEELRKEGKESLHELAAGLNERGVRTRKNKAWTFSNVWALVRRFP